MAEASDAPARAGVRAARGGRVLAGLVTLVLAAGAAAVGLGIGAQPAWAVKPACQHQPDPTGIVKKEPWAQAAYDAPEKIWPFSRGAGVTVAVIDAGVDGRHPQLSGKVDAGFDFVRNVPHGDVDCIPHGTAVAGIIAARRISGIGFYGLAPDARILPVRISERTETTDTSEPLDPARLAHGIDWATDHGAQVIDCAVVGYRNDPRVAAAVARAQAHGVVVVAMVGDAHSTQRDGIGPTTPTLTPYPAAYPGVVGVGAVDENDQRVDTSQIGTYVDLVAPGSGVVASAVQGQNSFDGTAIASGFVAATAALVLAERPSRIGDPSGRALVAAVTHRLEGSAAPALGTGSDSMAYGNGLVDPYRALTENLTNQAPAPLAGYTPAPAPKPDPAAQARARARHHSNDHAGLLAGAAGGLAVIVLALAVVMPRGRSRRWRAARDEAPPVPVLDEPEFLPGEALYERRHSSTRP